jgi:hypothetical protein
MSFVVCWAAYLTAAASNRLFEYNLFLNRKPDERGGI